MQVSNTNSTLSSLLWKTLNQSSDDSSSVSSLLNSASSASNNSLLDSSQSSQSGISGYSSMLSSMLGSDTSSSLFPSMDSTFQAIRQRILQGLAEQQYRAGNTTETQENGEAVLKTLSNAGFDMSKGVSLTVDSNCNITVEGNNPNKDKIEAFFKSNEDAANTVVHTYVKNDVLNTIQRGQLSQASSNPYLKNMLHWGTGVLSISQNGTSFSYE